MFAGTYYSVAGTYSDTVTTGTCDSITNLTLTVLPIANTNITDSICNGDSIVFGSTTIKTAGTYMDTLSSSTGCDSIITLTVTIKTGTVVNLTDSICAGDSILFAGTYYNVAGTYSDTVTTGTCDSITNLTLTVLPIANTNITDSICNGDSIVFGSTTIKTAGTYMDTLSSSTGCDSIVTLTVTLSSYISSNIVDSICPGDSILFGGNYIKNSGIYMDTINSLTSCDTIVTLTVSISSFVTPTITITSNTTSICLNQGVQFGSSITNGGASPVYQWMINGIQVTSGATFNSTPGQLANGDVVTCLLVSSLSCASPDSVYSNGITITVGISTTDTIKDTICQNDIYLFGGDTLTTSGVYFDTVTNSAGCDSITRLELDVLPVPIVIANSDVDTIGVGGTVNFTPNGSNASNYYWDFGDGNSSTLNTVSHTYNVPGVYTVVLRGDLLFGCSSYDTLTIVVINDIGINEQNKINLLTVYPNPTFGELNIDVSNYKGEKTSLEIHNVAGKLIYSKEFIRVNEKITIDLKELERGTYNLRLIGKGIQSNVRVIKMN